MQLAEVKKTCSTFEKENSEMKATVAELTLKYGVLKDKVTSHRHDCSCLECLLVFMCKFDLYFDYTIISSFKVH